MWQTAQQCRLRQGDVQRLPACLPVRHLHAPVPRQSLNPTHLHAVSPESFVHVTHEPGDHVVRCGADLDLIRELEEQPPVDNLATRGERVVTEEGGVA